VDLIEGKPTTENAKAYTVTDYSFSINDCFEKGFGIFKKQMGLFILFTVLYFILVSIAGFLVSGPLTAGYFIASHQINRGKTATLDHFFEGFQKFIPLLLYSLISGIILFFAFILLIIPGIYLAVGYTFAVAFIWFTRMDFWESMETSRKLVDKNWFGIFGLLILLGLLNIAGLLAIGIGLLFTVPITHCVIYATFDKITGIPEK